MADIYQSLIFICVTWLAYLMVDYGEGASVRTKAPAEPPTVLESMGPDVVSIHQAIKRSLAAAQDRAEEYEQQEENAESNGRAANSTSILIDGDIVVSDPDLALIMFDTNGRRKKRGIISSATARWQPRIPFYFVTGFTQYQKDRVRIAMDMWEAETCVTFEEIKDKYNLNETTLVFNNFLHICASSVGRSQRQYQSIWLGSNCYIELGVIVHELGHALGLWHEHSRPDRDDHVTVMYGNIAGSYQPDNLQKMSEEVDNTMDMSYDFGSIMHYSSGAYGADSLMSKDPLFINTYGQRAAPSFWDVKKINLALCNDTCDPGELASNCTNNGYQNPKDCTRCLCPNGFGGMYCERLQDNRGPENCGANYITAGFYRAKLYSPNYFNGGFRQGQECTWKITAPNRYDHVRAWFSSQGFSVFCSDYSSTANHWVEVRYQGDMSLTGPRFCGQTAPANEFISEGDSMMVLLNTTYPHTGTGWKFKIYYQVEPGNSSGCTPNPCENGAKCYGTFDETSYVCACDEGFAGDNCQDVITAKPPMTQPVLTTTTNAPSNTTEPDVTSSSTVYLILTTLGERCVFPFEYVGKEYTSCTVEGGTEDIPWCATVDVLDVDGDEWGYCALRERLTSPTPASLQPRSTPTVSSPTTTLDSAALPASTMTVTVTRATSTAQPAAVTNASRPITSTTSPKTTTSLTETTPTTTPSNTPTVGDRKTPMVTNWFMATPTTTTNRPSQPLVTPTTPSTTMETTSLATTMTSQPSAAPTTTTTPVTQATTPSTTHASSATTRERRVTMFTGLGTSIPVAVRTRSSSRRTTATSQSTAAGTTSAPSTSAKTASTHKPVCEDTFTTHPNMMTFRGVRVLHIETLTTCQKVCLQEPVCQAVDWNNVHRICRLHFPGYEVNPRMYLVANNTQYRRVACRPPEEHDLPYFAADQADIAAATTTMSLQPAAPVDACLSSPCYHGGTCVTDTVHSRYDCYCRGPYRGTRCQEQITSTTTSTEASPTQTTLMETSSTTVSTSTVTSPTTVTTTVTSSGRQNGKPSCGGLHCSNGGSCFLHDNTAWCECPAGFDGPQCQKSCGACNHVPGFYEKACHVESSNSLVCCDHGDAQIYYRHGTGDAYCTVPGWTDWYPCVAGTQTRYYIGIGANSAGALPAAQVTNTMQRSCNLAHPQPSV